MFYFPAEIWMLLVPIVVIWLLCNAAKGAGNFLTTDHSLPVGVERIKLRKMSSDRYLSRVLYAHHLTEYDAYYAYVRCHILKDETRVEADSKEELEEKVEQVFKDYKQKYEEWRRKEIYGK